MTAILLLAALLLRPLPAFAENWREKGGDHFIIYYDEGERFAKEVLDNAEVYYRRIATGLGYPRYSDFWTWDNRVKIYIYPDKESYDRVSQMPGWSHGMADYEKKIIVSYKWSEMFIDSILPHEIAHLVFRDFVGFTGKIPLWLDEGVAQWAETKKRKDLTRLAVEYYKRDKLLLVDDLMKLDIRDYSDMNRVYIRPTINKKGEDSVLFMDTNALVTNYYIVAVSLIDFLIARYGSKRFAHFCRELRDGKSVGDALRFAYPEHIQDLGELETRWRAYLARRAEE
jgi:hypothetical protein